MSKSPSLRRIQADIRELARDPSDQYFAAPMENDMFVWHFTIRGAEGTDFEGGIYHGRILLPAEYPYKPPHIMFLTPSGRFETNTKICLSFSAFHPELWQPAWGIRLILEALISFLPTPGDGAIGALDYKPEERRRLAKQSQSFCCPVVGPVAKLLPKLNPDRKKAAKSARSGDFSKEIAELQRLQKERGGKNRSKSTTNSGRTEETTTTTPTSEADGAEHNPEARIAEDAKCSKDVPELLSADASKDDDAAGSTIEEITDGDNPLTDSNAATTDDNANDSAGTASGTAAVSEEEPEHSVVAAHNTPRGNVDDIDNDISKLYDPLLNISIFLMFCICILLCKKGMALSRELNELRAIPIVDTLMDKATSAASSVAASATTSEEL
jgi:ubiquitin-conjugating enzyme E2 J1